MASQAEIDGMFPAMMENFQADKAEGVNATIQFDLSGDNGGLYWVTINDGAVTHGEGDVEQNYVKAAHWYQVAAEQGMSGSQMNLASMYADGKGVVKSYEQAYIWSSLSEKHNKKYSNTHIYIKELTPAQIKEAEKEVLKLYKQIYSKDYQSPVVK